MKLYYKYFILLLLTILFFCFLQSNKSTDYKVPLYLKDGTMSQNKGEKEQEEMEPAGYKTEEIGTQNAEIN